MKLLTLKQRRQRQEMTAWLIDTAEAVVNGEVLTRETLATWPFGKIKACAGGILNHELAAARRAKQH